MTTEPSPDLADQIRHLTADLKAERRKSRELKRNLEVLAGATTAAIAAFDEVMKGPSTPERGQKIAVILNGLSFANESARHFGLDEKFPLKKLTWAAVEWWLEETMRTMESIERLPR